jgi:hypothetical protein
LIGAGLVAASPLLVMTDGLIMSESVTATVVAATVWLAARALRLRTPATMATFGAVAALGALARAELVLVIPIVAVAALCHRRGDSRRRRLELAGVALAAGVLVMAPWVIRNLVTFERPVFLSDGWDLTVVGANCPSTYSGPLIGTNDLRCGAGVRDDIDQSVAFADARTKGLRYARDHVDRWPAVAFARLGRTFGFFNVRQQIDLDHDFERRERAISTAGLVTWWLSVAVGIGGMVALHRRRVSLVPLLAPCAAVAIAVAVTYGNTRLRVPADVALLIASGVGLDARLRRRAAATPTGATEPERSGREPRRERQRLGHPEPQ